MDTDILTIINSNNIEAAKLHELFTKMNTVDIADAFEHVSKEKVIRAFRLLPKNKATEVFSFIDTEKQQIIVEGLTDKEVAGIMNELFVDDAVDFIEEMPANVVNMVLRNITWEKRALINQFLQYPEDSAGSVMTTEYVELSEDVIVRDALNTIRMSGVNKVTIYTCYVIGPDKKLIGAVSAEALLHAELTKKIDEIMDENVIFTLTTDDREAVAGMFRKYGLLAMPVVDHEQQLVGIITVDDVLHIIEEEDTEDFEKMAALNPADESYLKTGVIQQAKNRIIWLLVLMLSATITGAIITSFENSLTVLPALIAFIPMLMGAGGNAGAQSSTVIIRGMALGEITLNDVLKVLWREIRVGLICGLALGIANFIRIFLMNEKNAMLSLVVTLSLCVTLIVAKSIGCTLPILAKKLKTDPAIMAAPLVTTIVDGTTLIVYFSIAKIAFKI
jgi:magnesium transporter